MAYLNFCDAMSSVSRVPLIDCIVWAKSLVSDTRYIRLALTSGIFSWLLHQAYDHIVLAHTLDCIVLTITLESIPLVLTLGHTVLSNTRAYSLDSNTGAYSHRSNTGAYTRIVLAHILWRIVLVLTLGCIILTRTLERIVTNAGACSLGSNDEAWIYESSPFRWPAVELSCLDIPLSSFCYLFTVS